METQPFTVPRERLMTERIARWNIKTALPLAKYKIPKYVESKIETEIDIKLKLKLNP